jgi:hypothetical protein
MTRIPENVNLMPDGAESVGLAQVHSSTWITTQGGPTSVCGRVNVLSQISLEETLL